MPALEKATITIKDPSGTSTENLKVQFNPKEFSISYSQGYTNEKAVVEFLQGKSGGKAPPIMGGTGTGKGGSNSESSGDNDSVPNEPTPAQMSVTLYFDESIARKDVRKKYIKPLVECMKFSKNMSGGSDGSKAEAKPPTVIWTWGLSGDQFEGNLISLNTQFTKFLADGTPVGATVQLSIQSTRDDVGAKGRIKGALVAVIGEKNIPQNKLGPKWASFLENANIDDPLSMKPGDIVDISSGFKKNMPAPLAKNLAMLNKPMVAGTGLTATNLAKVASFVPNSSVRNATGYVSMANGFNATKPEANGASNPNDVNSKLLNKNIEELKGISTNGSTKSDSTTSNSSAVVSIAGRASTNGFSGNSGKGQEG